MNKSLYMILNAVFLVVMFSISLPSMARMHGGHMMGDYDDMMMNRSGGYMHDRMGYGMMGGGMGFCMGMGGPAMMLDLTDKQREQIRDLHRSQRKSTWDLMDKMMDQRYKLAKLYDAEPLDASAIGKAYDEMFALKRQMIVSCVESENKVRGLLTDKQRESYQGMRRRMGPMGTGMMHY
jgi:Spy/CpxP family protein refolding chaperone